MSRVALFLNGLAPKKIPNLSQFDKIYCTDGAYHYMNALNIQPDVISGDFDSFDRHQIPVGIEVVETPDQEFTDFEKALHLIHSRGHEEVYIYGSSGMEHDHFLGNLSTALQFKKQLTLLFFDDYSYYFFADKTTVLEGYQGRTISLYPYPIAENISTEGLKYPLHNETLDLTKRIGIRNQAIEQRVEISFDQGNLLLFVMNQK